MVCNATFNNISVISWQFDYWKSEDNLNETDWTQTVYERSLSIINAKMDLTTGGMYTVIKSMIFVYFSGFHYRSVQYLSN